MNKEITGFSPCNSHDSLIRMPEYERAVDIARNCPDCETF